MARDVQPTHNICTLYHIQNITKYSISGKYPRATCTMILNNFYGNVVVAHACGSCKTQTCRPTTIILKHRFTYKESMIKGQGANLGKYKGEKHLKN